MICTKVFVLVGAAIGSCLAAEPGACSKSVRQLEYWIGDWSVSSPDAPGRGHAKVFSSLDGCLVTESWASDTSDHKGENAIAYDPADKAWHGLFVDNHGRAHALKGSATADGAQLEGPARDENGRPVLKRIRVVPVDPGHTQHIWEKSTDKGATWVTEYRMDYVRRK